MGQNVRRGLLGYNGEDGASIDARTDSGAPTLPRLKAGAEMVEEMRHWCARHTTHTPKTVH